MKSDSVNYIYQKNHYIFRHSLTTTSPYDMAYFINDMTAYVFSKLKNLSLGRIEEIINNGKISDLLDTESLYFSEDDRINAYNRLYSIFKDDFNSDLDNLDNIEDAICILMEYYFNYVFGLSFYPIFRDLFCFAKPLTSYAALKY